MNSIAAVGQLPDPGDLRPGVYTRLSFSKGRCCREPVSSLTDHLSRLPSCSKWKLRQSVFNVGEHWLLLWISGWELSSDNAILHGVTSWPIRHRGEPARRTPKTCCVSEA